MDAENINECVIIWKQEGFMLFKHKAMICDIYIRLVQKHLTVMAT